MPTSPRRQAIALFALVASLTAARCGGAKKEATASPPETATQEQAPAAPAAAPSPAADAQAHREQAEPETDQALEPGFASGAVKGVPAPTNTAPIVAIANYFTELPGLDVAGLKPSQREKFLQQVNSELCPCGCKHDTLARCYVNDPKCTAVRPIVQKMFDQVKGGR